MATMVTAQTAPQTAAEYEATFERLMAEAENLNEQMRHDRAEIERLTAETAALKSETRALLTSMGAKL